MKIILLLLISISSLAQSYEFKVEYKCYRLWNGIVHEWGEWTQWTKESAYVVFDPKHNDITIFKNPVSRFIVDGTGEIEENRDYKLLRFYCTDKDDDICHIDLVVKGRNDFQLYIRYPAIQIAYSMSQDAKR
jgi:hypothetical protein